MNITMDLTVAVIAKECLPGRVKTRLTPPLTQPEAAAIAQLSLARTLDTVRLLPVQERLLVIAGTPRSVDAEGFTLVAQAGGSLDERLAAICDSVAGPLLIVGMDTPQFSVEHAAPLFKDWSSATPLHDAWLGPAADGGFWAVALRRPDGALIRGVPMSTGATGAAQLARLSAAGLSIGLLTPLRDMDYFGDAVEIAAELPGTPFAQAVAEAVAAAGEHLVAGARP
ncbi:TIGR04282 family arsenosugar biosynthesis glycosyltransferase [Pseudarthrobacter sp. N5]|uniref:TIGR04282 family arsenosugar biosynthesis glycosyltransferase n=1 Tax=Pseudarthrobacter sp. N5 TaxID=3418416 RepID=UPI003CEDB275